MNKKILLPIIVLLTMPTLWAMDDLASLMMSQSLEEQENKQRSEADYFALILAQKEQAREQTAAKAQEDEAILYREMQVSCGITPQQHKDWEEQSAQATLARRKKEKEEREKAFTNTVDTISAVTKFTKKLHQKPTSKALPLMEQSLQRQELRQQDDEQYYIKLAQQAQSNNNSPKVDDPEQEETATPEQEAALCLEMQVSPYQITREHQEDVMEAFTTAVRASRKVNTRVRQFIKNIRTQVNRRKQANARRVDQQEAAQVPANNQDNEQARIDEQKTIEIQKEKEREQYRQMMLVYVEEQKEKEAIRQALQDWFGCQKLHQRKIEEQEDAEYQERVANHQRQIQAQTIAIKAGTDTTTTPANPTPIMPVIDANTSTTEMAMSNPTIPSPFTQLAAQAVTLSKNTLNKTSPKHPLTTKQTTIAAHNTQAPEKIEELADTNGDGNGQNTAEEDTTESKIEQTSKTSSSLLTKTTIGLTLLITGTIIAVAKNLHHTVINTVRTRLATMRSATTTADTVTELKKA